MTQFARIVNTSNDSGDTVTVKTGQAETTLHRGQSVEVECHGKPKAVEIVGASNPDPQYPDYRGKPQVFVAEPVKNPEV